MTTFDWNPSARKLRQFAAVAVLFLATVAALTHSRGGGWLAQVLPLALALGIGVAGYWQPDTLRLPYVLLSVMTYPIGLVVSHLILRVLFFGVITPLGVLARLARPDPLATRLDGRKESHWQERRRPHAKAEYLRQA
jgi:hypothetical protein